MFELSTTSLYLLAVDASATITSREFDWPESPLGWLVLLGGGLALLLWVVWLYVRDTRDLSAGWKLWLTALRLSVQPLSPAFQVNVLTRFAPVGSSVILN